MGQIYFRTLWWLTKQWEVTAVSRCGGSPVGLGGATLLLHSPAGCSSGCSASPAGAVAPENVTSKASLGDT